MAEQGQPKPKDMHKKKRTNSNSQSTPPPPGTASAIAWTDETELETNIDDNTPSIEMTTDSERRMSDHSQIKYTTSNPVTASCIFVMHIKNLI